ncbi:MAG TPA: 3-phosphoserine/phosphohydroxythreonine transaminase [Actinomycetota bacterium]|nr:3-phosphoserine/phosphohydroxythreonine transaminase [Actinomycetota bacterium]
MLGRSWNFSAGPATLPLPVLERVREDLLELPGAGASVLEISHRGPAFDEVIVEAERNLRELLAVPDTHRVLFLQGGASLQFSMAPMNLLGDGTAEYVVGGSWAKKALAEARKVGATRVVWDGADDGFTTIPDLGGLELDPSAAYLHVTSNETIQGVELPAGFEPANGASLVCDASSDFLSRPIPVERYGLLYAGVQKNAGPAGLTVVLLHEDLLERIPDGLPTMLDYRTFADSGSMYNTPPVFAIYVLMLVTRWLRDEVGGIGAMHERNRRKAALLYEAIDGSDGFYRGHAARAARSLMNVTWRLPSEDLEKGFLTEAREHRLLELKGHRSVGGIRASIYNAMPLEGVQALRAFMDDFASRSV